jgi:Fe-S oxidoreductase
LTGGDGSVETQTLIRLVVGLGMTAIVAVLALRRVWWLFTLVRSGQPATDRTDHIGTRIWTQVKEVFGQTRLLRWSIPGLAHFFTMWGFFILITVYIEAYGTLFTPHFAIPIVGHWDALGFLQDFIALAVLAGITTFAIIRLRSEPKEYGRDSRFYGSHTGGAWLILFMIFNVIWTYALFRGSSAVTGALPYGWGAFFSHGMGALLTPLGVPTNEVIETVALLLHIGVALGFLIIVLNSKHLHIFLAPVNVTVKRLPNGLGPLLPMQYDGKPIDFEDPPEDATFGRGKIEDFTWKGMLDFATCTECGRCQSQCPAWNTGKPLSPKLVIMDLRDHWMAKAPYILGSKPTPDESTPEGGLGEELRGEKHAEEHHVPESGFGRVPADSPLQATRPLVGTAEQLGVIDPDVLWSCTTCGACVEQCPVDIEHVDHIVDMRRYQVMMESEFPSELSVLFKNLETKSNPWGQNAKDRLNWISEVEFDVPVFGTDADSFAGYEYLFWVGCAGAFEDRAKKTTKAVAELLSAAGVKYLVLGADETCNGDSARRSGNEFLFQQLAAQAVETLNGVFEGVETVDRKIVVTCPHCFNTLGREYKQLGANYTVVHHTQLLNRLVRDKKLVPVSALNSDVTYHDPCYLGRHNKVYEAPRELINASGVTLKEMPRHAETGLCCGAGGARMWMEEHIGKRVNNERVDEALMTVSDGAKIATGCPFCRVMMTDGLTDRQESGKGEGVEVLDVAQLLLNSLDMSTVTLPEKGAAAKAAAERAAAAAPAEAPEEEAEEEAEAPAAKADTAEAKPVTGLGIAGGAKRPGAKSAAPAADKPAEAADAKPVKGLGIAGGAKRPGAKKAAAAEKPAEAEAEKPTAATEPAKEAAPVKGLGLAAGAKRPGAKKTAAPPAKPAETAAEKPAEAEPEAAAEAPAEEAPKVEQPPVKGLGLAAGAKRPGARKSQPAAAKPEPKPEPEAQPAPEPEKDGEATAQAEPEQPQSSGDGNGEASTPPVKGLGIARGARPPGKR